MLSLFVIESAEYFWEGNNEFKANISIRWGKVIASQSDNIISGQG